MEIVIKSNLIFIRCQIPFLLIDRANSIFAINLCYTYEYEALYNNS